MPNYEITYRFNKVDYRTIIPADNKYQATHKLYGLIKILTIMEYKEDDPFNEIRELFGGLGLKI